jgi:salicylate hydroxylase
MADKKVLIVGAGLGGLVAASCLMKAGYDVEVYEQAPALAEVGAGIQMSANPMHVLRYLGLENEALKIGVKPGGYVFRLHDTGEIIQQFSLSEEHERQHGAPYVQLHRADLHEMLARAARQLKPDVIHLNRRATGFSEDDDGVTLHFADGATARGDILVGADAPDRRRNSRDLYRRCGMARDHSSRAAAEAVS